MKWLSKKLDVVADFCLGKMLDQKKNRGEPLPYLANINVRWGEFDLNDLREMRYEHHELDRFGLQDGDIVMCEGGEPGRCAIWRSQRPNMMIQKALHRIRPHECLRPEFLYYFFSFKGRTGQLSPLFTGATIKHLPREKLALVDVSVPPLPTQDHIVQVLTAYDDLIENNRRRIQLLEQAARLLYKEWFIHFRFPGHEHVEFVNGRPNGWEARTLGDCATLLSGKTPSKSRSEFWDGNHPWVSSGELTSVRIARTTLTVTDQAIHAGSRLVPKGTILAVVRGMSLAKEFRIALAARPVTFNQDLKAIAANDDVDPLFLFHCLDHQRNTIRDRAADASHGTKKLDTPVLLSIPILIPSRVVQSMFRDIVAPIHAQWDVLDSTNVRLAKARDLLIPRLMNGEVAV